MKPSAIASVGIFLGAFMIALAGAAAAFGLHILAYCASNSPKPASFRSIAQSILPNAAVFFDTAIAVKCFGVSISYLIIIGDLMPSIMAKLFPAEAAHSASSVLLNRQFWITFSMIPLVPLSFQKRLDALKYTSIVALMAAAYLLWIIVFYFLFDPTMPHAPSTDIDLVRISPSFFKSLSIFVFAYTCHQNVRS
jgi:amino acid permease